MEKIRSFIAIELFQSIKNDLTTLQVKLKSAGCPGRWVPAKNIHLTLCFLGEIRPSQVSDIQLVLTQTCEGFAPFNLYMGKLGVFPNFTRPRVVWVGLRGDLETLSNLQNKLETAMVVLGIKPENRPFCPHLTLARLCEDVFPAERQKITEIISHISYEIETALPVTEICFMRSSLTPSGAIYTQLSTHQLNRQKTNNDF